MTSSWLNLKESLKMSKVKFRRVSKNIFTFPVRLGAPLDQPDGVLGELLHRLNELHDLVHV